MSITANNCYAAAGCVGRFVNPITDVCWKCLFPITIAGFKVVSSSMPDTNASGRLICLFVLSQGFQCLYLVFLLDFGSQYAL
nr:TraU family protein [Orientia tsutsugamushi]